LPADQLLTGSELVVRLLQTHGISLVFGLSGNGILGIFDAALTSGLTIIDTRDESAAVQSAGGRALVTGEPQVAFVTEGPGFANALPGIAAMNHDGVPVIVITNCESDDLFGTGAFQEMPQAEMAERISKWSVKVHAIEHLPDIIAQAFRVAASGVPGVVAITLANQVLLGRVSASLLTRRALPYSRQTSAAAPSHAFTHSLIATLRAAQRPLLLVGSMARWDGASDAIGLFLESTKVPVAACDKGRGVVSDDHPCYIGEGRPALLPPTALEADVVVVLGERIDYLLEFGKRWKPGTVFIQVYPDVAQLSRSIDVQLSTMASTKLVLEAVNAELRSESWPESAWLNATRADYLSARQASAAVVADIAGDLHPARVARLVVEAVGADASYVIDGANCSLWAKQFVPIRRAEDFLEWGRLGMIGMGLPYALGAQSVRPGRPVILLVGDGSLGFHLMELETALRHQLPVLIVVFNDSGWGIERHFQIAAFGRETATTLSHVRYDLMAQALGAFGAYAETESELEAALQEAKRCAKPAIVNVRTSNVGHPVVLRVATALKRKHSR
jgi:acetolactate synthase-1/2/3 large subunit